MEKTGIAEKTKSSRMVGYLAAAVALLAVAFIVLIACATYLIEKKDCDDTTTTAVSEVATPESCDEFHYEGAVGNFTYTELTTVCQNAKTEFGIVRDKDTGYIMNTFFVDYKQEVSIVYLPKSHKCLVKNEVDTHMEDDLEDYRNNNYGKGPREYSVGDAVESWDAIPQQMRGFCSPRNTFEWLNVHTTVDDHRQKRHNLHLCCCFYIVGPYLYVDWACGNNLSCSFGAGCTWWIFAHPTSCTAGSGSTCFSLFNQVFG